MPLSKYYKMICVSLVFAAIALISYTQFSDPAYAVRVSLKRVVFEGQKRSEILTLINSSGEPQTYRLGWRRYKMDETEALRAVEEGDPANSDILWADDMVRFAPRRVTIPPGGSQQIRLLLRRPKDLQEGEYRAHLWIIAETEPSSFADQTSGSKQAIKLAVQPAISLPIFVRNGKLDVNVSIADAQLKKTDDGLQVTLKLNRTGSRSIYGDFEFICTDGGQDLVLKQTRGIAVYTDVEYRNMDFKIALNESKASTCNNMKILYRGDTNDPEFAQKTIAQATATLQ